MALPRLGSVSYLNALPLTRGLKGLVTDVPSRLAARFREGEVEIALLPSVEALRMPERPVLPGMAIASPGPVDSVLLFHRTPLHEIQGVLLDESSRTSAALTRVLLAERFKISPEYGPCGPETDPRRADADAVLLIGDPALLAPRDGLEVLDLAGAWFDWTGLPFCFAVWVARDEQTAGRALEVLQAAKKRGLRERPQIAREGAAAIGLPEKLLLTYLTKRITYDLGPPEQEALNHFANLCRKQALL